MENKRQQIISFLVEQGGKSESGYTWSEIAELHGLNTDKKTLKRLSDWWRAYLKAEEKRITDVPVKGLSLKSAWQSANGTWLYSYKNDNKVDFEELKASLIEELSVYSPVVKRHSYGLKNDAVAYEIGLPDLHFGIEPVELTKQKYHDTINTLLRRCPYVVDHFVVTVGNDLLNSDYGAIENYTTTNGTRQHDVVDWKTSFNAAWQTIVESVNSLVDIAPVKLYIVEGNHDMHKSFYVGEVLTAWFRNNENVEVFNSNSSREYWQWGSNLVMFDHGQLKTDKYPLVMATEEPVLFSKSKHREVHCGHIHHEVTKEYNGVKVRFLPSLCPKDAWHKKNGYLAMPAAQGFIWDKNEGLISINYVNYAK